MPTTVSGRISEVILARLEPGEDLRQGLLAAIRERDIKSGVILSITGGLERATLKRFPKEGGHDINTEPIEIAGPMEVSGHGIIGRVEAPDFGDAYFGVGDDFIHDGPYLHVHLTATSAGGTVCGHLMNGSPVLATHNRSHFTVVIGRIDGAMVKMMGKAGPGPIASRVWHELVQF
ncbi:MAG: DNA-binding protein [Dehalococcoidales bacterium]|nr:DNA-binding protein [Dehalococcoidales bacterium]